MENKSHLTAIRRNKLPNPTQWLLDKFLIRGRTLDYGCGRCHEINNQFFSADGFDPHYRPNGINYSSYDTIICNYVLNVLPTEQERKEVCEHILGLLSSNGVAYITVRNDRIKLKGPTKRKTWQGLIVPPKGNIFASKSHWIMYHLTN